MAKRHVITLSLGIFIVLAAVAEVGAHLPPGTDQPNQVRRPSTRSSGHRSAPATKGSSKSTKPKPVILSPDVSVGAVGVFSNLSVLTIESATQKKTGALTTLAAALQSNDAVIRELDNGGAVNKVLIKNQGGVAIVAAAGLILKGGKQDRIIAQHTIIAPKTTVMVDAFCVERGRWNPQRAGVATNGKFRVLDTLAVREVRIAGQYNSDQGEVWTKVAGFNRIHKKRPASETLVASVGDPKLRARQRRLGKRVQQFLSRQPNKRRIVGLAYAIDGRVRMVRWYANHKLFTLLAPAVLNTAALEAISIKSSAPKKKGSKITRTVHPKDVAKFVAARKKAIRTIRRKTAGQNENVYRFSKKGYASRLLMKRKGTSAPVSAISAFE